VQLAHLHEMTGYLGVAERYDTVAMNVDDITRSAASSQIAGAVTAVVSSVATFKVKGLGFRV